MNLTGVHSEKRKIMEIIGKEFRCKNSLTLSTEVGYQDKYYDYLGYIYIHIYNAELVFIMQGKKDRAHIIGDYGKINPDVRKTKIENIKKLFKNGIHPAASYYVREGMNILITEKNNFENETEINFKGEIMLEGDAIKGAFFVKGEQTIPSRVYYNLDKPLPNPLLEEEQDDDEIV